MDRNGQSALALDFTDEAAMLLESAAAFAKAEAAAHPFRQTVEIAQGYRDDVWREMVDLGWPGLVVPEELGGSGLEVSAAVPIIEALGARLISSPLMPSLLAAAAMTQARESAPAKEWLPKLAQGAIGCLALSDGNGWDWHAPKASAKRRGGSLVLSGDKRFAPFASAADVVIASVMLEREARLVTLSREQLASHVEPEICTDSTQRPARISLDGLEIPDAQLLPVTDLDHLVRAATLLQSAEMCGGVAGAIEDTLDYLRNRLQFGRPIGAYQGLKHTMADAYVQYELLRSLLYGAASNLNGGDAELLVRMAKTKANELFLHVADRAVQFHGGFGFTYDCDAGFYLRRAMWGQSQFGNARHHRKRLAALLLDSNAARGAR